MRSGLRTIDEKTRARCVVCGTAEHVAAFDADDAAVDVCARCLPAVEVQTRTAIGREVFLSSVRYRDATRARRRLPVSPLAELLRAS